MTIEGGLAQESHPSLNDKAYLERRNMITNISASYDLVSSPEIPRIDYTKEERQIWHTLFDELSEAQDKHAPLPIAQNFKRLKEALELSNERMPQLEEIARYHRETSGWTLRPVGGLLTLQEFMNQLAFKVWPATQYIRHSSALRYSHEPDFIHEVFGH